MLFSTPRKWSVGDVTMGVLGLNVWITFLLLPALHFGKNSPRGTIMVFIVVAPLLLAAGLYYRHKLALLIGFPLTLIIPSVVNPRLVGVNVYSPWSFCLVAASFLAYMLVSLAILRRFELPAEPAEGRDLSAYELSPRWRRRFRIYRWMAALAAIFPIMLFYSIFLDPDIQANLRGSFPGRFTEAVVFFGIGSLVLWLLLFYADFLTPLKAHVRGDPYMHNDLRLLRRAALRAVPSPSFYIAVITALALIVLFFLTR